MFVLTKRSLLSCIVTAMIGIAFSIRPSVFAQEAEDLNNSDSQEDSQSSIEVDEEISNDFDVVVQSIPIEEIAVTAERSRSSIRTEMERLRTSLFNDYSALNQIDKYDIDCRSTRFINSHIPEDFCWPAFYEQALADNAQESFWDISILQTPANVARNHERDWEELRNNVVRIANENPELKEALLEYLRLDAALTRKQQECEVKPAFLFIFKLCR